MSRLVLVIASTNAHKIQEIKAMLQDLPLDIKAVNEVDPLPAIVEDGDTFEANAIKKAVETAKAVGYLVLADDSGLAVEALQGQPGVYSARFAGEPSNDQRNNDKLLDLMAGLPIEQRVARFHCVIAVAWPSGEVKTYSGSCEGTIGFSPQGDHGFGYDPLFQVPGYDQTFAQLGEEIKNQISHRSRALVQLKELFHQDFL